MKNYSLLRNITVLEEYISALSVIAEDCLVCIAVQGSPGKYISDEASILMVQLGMVNIQDKEGWSYVFAKHRGEIIVSRIGMPENSVEEDKNISTSVLHMASRGEKNGNEAIISINGQDFSFHGKGLNIVVADLHRNKLYDAVNFDTTVEGCPCQRQEELYFAIYGYSLCSNDFFNWWKSAEKYFRGSMDVDSASKMLKSIDDIMSYLYMLKLISAKCMIILAVKDTPGSNMSMEILDMIHSLGFSNFTNELWRMYIGISLGGKVMFDQVAARREDPVVAVCENDKIHHKIAISSKAWRKGNEATVMLEGKNLSVNKRGVNIVVLDPIKGTVMDSIAFDCHTEKYLFFRV